MIVNTPKKTHLLLVEDEALIAMVEKRSLESKGYAVHHVSCGEDAVAAMGVQTVPIDLILMDIDLGSGLDGTQTAQIILADHDIPIIFLSSHTEPEVVEKTEKITSYGYVVKNSSITVLDASIKMAFRLLETRRRANDTFAHSINGLCVHRIVRDASGSFYDCEYLQVNNAFERHTGLASRELIGRTIRDLYPGQEADEVIRLYDDVLSGRADARQDIYFKPTQSWYELSVFGTRADEFTVVIQNITERERLVGELRKEHELATRIIEDGPVAITQVDRDGRIVFANSHAQRLLGLAEGDTESLSYNSPEWRITAVDGSPFPDEQLPFRRVMSTDQAVYDVQHAISRPGTRRILSVNGAPLHDEHGRIDRLVFAIQDVTELKQFGQDLANQKQYLETILNTTSDGFWIVTPDKKIDRANDAYCRMSGYTVAELGAMTINDIDAIEDPQATTQRMQLIMDTGSHTFETQHRRKDGSIMAVEISASRLDREDGVCVVCFCRDFGQRLHAQQTLKESRDRYQTLVDRSPDIVYLFGTQRGGILWSEATRRILGFDPERVTRDSLVWNQAIHPDDRATVEQAVADAIAGRGFAIEYRIQAVDGRWVWLHDQMINRTEVDGEIIIQGHAVDITEQKATERHQLRLAESAVVLQSYSADTIDYQAIAETVRELSGASFAAMNVVENNDTRFTTVAITGVPEHLMKASAIFGYPLVGRLWDHDLQREAALGGRRTTVFASLAELASGVFSVTAAKTMANLFRLGELAITRIVTTHDTVGDFTLLFTHDQHLRRRNLVETYASMVGITIERIRTEQRNRQLVSDKETLLKEVQHRVKNNMNAMASLLSLQAGSLGDARAVEALKVAEGRVRSMQVLYDHLYGADSHTEGSLVAYLRTLVPQVVRLFPHGEAVQVEVTSRAEQCMVMWDGGRGKVDPSKCCTIDAKRLSTVGLVVNELVTNAMKHAFADWVSVAARGSQPPSITVATDCLEQEITIAVSDNGCGLPGAFSPDSGKGFGWVMIDALVRELSGTIRCVTGDTTTTGTRVVLTFPVRRR